jgi:hypothetical protein
MIQNMKQNIQYKILSLGLILYMCTGIVQAAPLYTPGQTLDPSCLPSNPDCAVVVPALSGTNTDITSLAPLTAATSTWLTILNTLRGKDIVATSSLQVGTKISLNADGSASFANGLAGVATSGKFTGDGSLLTGVSGTAGHIGQSYLEQISSSWGGVNIVTKSPGSTTTRPWVWKDLANNLPFAAVEYNSVEDGSKAGALATFGIATENYGNLAGYHVYNSNIGGDNRAFVFRVKDPAGGSGDQGAYVLYETRFNPSSPDWTGGTYANWLVSDENGNVGIGQLGEASDSPGTPLHPPFKVSAYGSDGTGAYPAFGFASLNGSYSLANTPVSGAIEYDGTHFYFTEGSTRKQLQLVNSTAQTPWTSTIDGAHHTLNNLGRLVISTTTITTANGGDGSGSFPASGVMNRWNFDGDMVETINGIDAVTETGQELFTTGLGNQAYLFDGSTVVDVPGYAPVTGSAARTTSLWFKTDTGTLPVSDSLGLLSYGSDANAGQAWEILLNNSSVHNIWVHWIGGFAASAPLPEDVGFINLVDDNWHLVTATYNGSVVRLYIDGNFISEQGASLNTGTDSLYIGSRIGGGSAFAGAIDQVAVWNRALTDQEILDMYNEFSFGGPGGTTTTTHAIIDGNGNATLASTTITADLHLSSLPNNDSANYLCIDGNNKVSYSTTACTGLSSKVFKENIKSIPTGLAQVMKLNPVSYQYKHSAAPGDPSTHLGFIAEEVDTVNKTLVDYDTNGLPHSVKYTEFIPLLTKAVQEQEAQINSVSNVFVLDTNKEVDHIQMMSKNGVLWCVSINQGDFQTQKGKCL